MWTPNSDSYNDQSGMSCSHLIFSDIEHFLYQLHTTKALIRQRKTTWWCQEKEISIPWMESGAGAWPGLQQLPCSDLCDSSAGL